MLRTTSLYFAKSALFALKIILLGCCISNSGAYAQEATNIEIKQIKELDEVHLNIDSIRTQVEDTAEMVKVLLSLANKEGLEANFVAAINYGVEAVNIAQEAKMSELELPSLGFLYYSYSNLGITEKANEYLQQLEVLNKENKNAKVQLYVHLSKASSFLENGNPQKAYEEIIEVENFRAENEDLQVSLDEEALIYQLKGTTYSDLKQLDSSSYFYNKALETFENDSIVYGFTKIGIIENAIKEKDFDHASSLLNAMEPFVYTTKDNRMEEYFLEVGMELAEKSDNKELALKNQSKLNDLKDKKNKNLKAITNSLLKEIKTQNENSDKKSNKNSFLYILLFAVLLISALLYWRKRNTLQNEVENNVLEEDNKEINIEKNALPVAKEKTAEKSENNSLYIPEETLASILEGLEKFEKSKDYLKQDISLSKLAGKIKTNNKYLSHVINVHKEHDFSNYINELRINYIINKIDKDPKYREYKIAYLAEESGFSSHSKFTSVFKKVKGLTPSEYIRSAKK